MPGKGIKTNSLWNISNYGFSVVSLFFLFPFMIKHLGDSNYGFFIFLGTINGMASIANFGFGEASLRFVALYHNSNDKSSIKRIISTSFWTYILLGSVTTITIVLLAEPIVGLLKDLQFDLKQAIYLVRISAVTFLIRFIFGLFSTIPQAVQRFDVSSKIAIIETILRVVFYIVVLLTGHGLMGVVYAELLLAIIVSAINITISSKLLDTSDFFSKFTSGTLKEIFNYSIFSFLTQIVGLLWQYTDRILLGFFIGSAAIAYFSVPQQIIFKILGLVAAASVVLFPRFSLTKLDNRSKNLFKEFTLISLLFTIIVFSTLSLVVKDFIALWITPEFAAETKSIAVILSVSCMIRGAFPVYENLFKGIGKPVNNMYITIASSLIIVILDFLLIPRLGLNGAGLAYLISPIVGVFAIIYIWKRILKTSLDGPFKDYLMPLILSYALLAIFFFIKTRINIEPSWTNIIFQVLGFVIIQALMIFTYFRLFSRQSWETVLKVRYSVREIFKRDQQ